MSAVDEAVYRLVERSRGIVGSSPSVVSLGVAGKCIRLIAAGSPMLDFVGPAFAHLPRLADDLPADLTVYLWDAETTGEAYPSLPLPAVEQAAHGVTALDDVIVSYRSIERSISLLLRSTSEAFFVVGSLDVYQDVLRTAPLRELLSWWFTDQGKLLAHSAAVSTGEGAALLVGPGGSGKSSTALACLAAGMGYLGDDYVIVDPESLEVWSAFSSAKLVEEHHQHHPHLMTSDSTTANQPGPLKRIGWPGVEFSDRVAHRADIRALVLPVVTRGPECRLLPSTTSRALLALAPTTVFQAQALKQRAFELAAQVVQPFQPYRLELGEGAEQVPAMLARLIAAGREGS